MRIVGQTVENMVNVEREGVKLITLNVDPNELFRALKQAVSNDIDEEEVLKRYSLDLPADEHALDPTSFVEARDQIIRDKRIDTTQQYGLMKNEDYKPKMDVKESDIVTLWPREVWAAVWAARDQVEYKSMLCHDMKYFQRRGY
jgi:hypothetical protein